MKIRTLQLTNYRRHRDVTIEFPEGVFAVVGQNGSGKSSLLEAIGFALFGVQATRTAKAQLRHDGAAPSDPVRVVLTLELSGQAIEVMREFRGVNLTAHAGLTVDGKPLVTSGANSHAAVTSEIERLLGMDRTAFFTSIVAQQKELSRLADMNAAERKQMILRMLGIDSLDRAIEEARARRRGAEARVQDLRDALPDASEVQERLAGAERDLKAAQKQQAEAEAARQKAAEATLKAQADHDRQAKAAEASRAAGEQLRAAETSATSTGERLAELTQQSKAATEASEEAERLRAGAEARPAAAQALTEAQRRHDQANAARHAATQLVAVEKQLAELPAPRDPGNGRAEEAAVQAAQKRLGEAREAQAARRAQAKQLSDHLTGLASADAHSPCPFCQQPLEHQLPRLREDLTAQADRLAVDIKAADADITDAAAALDQARRAHQAWQDLRRAFDTAATRREELTARLDDARRLAGPPQVDLPALEPLLAALSAAETAERARIRALAVAEGLPRLETAKAVATTNHQKAQDDLAAARAAITASRPVDLTPAVEALKAAQAAERACDAQVHQAATAFQLASQAVEHGREAVERLTTQRATLKTAEADLRLWTALAGGRNQGLLEQFRSHLVGKIRPAINHEASRLLSRFTDGRYAEMLLDEDYGVFVIDEGVPYALARFSGGESDLAHLALRLAVSRLLTARTGAAELRFLALDEVFGSLDRRRRDAVVGALHGLEQLYSQVVLVTHQEDLRDVLDAVLEVQEDGDATAIRFHHG